METIPLPPHFPSDLQRVHLLHVSPLSTSQSSCILDRIISASKLPTTPSADTTSETLRWADEERARLDYAFIDPTRLCGRQHILTAIMQAVIVTSRSKEAAQGRGRKTKTVHSEVIWSLSPGNNVGESLKRFGLTPTSTSLLLVRFSNPQQPAQQVLEDMLSIIPPSEIGPAIPTLSTTDTQGHAGRDIDAAIRSSGTDWTQLNKIYKLAMPSTLLDKVKRGEVNSEEIQTWEELCCTSVAMKLVAA